MSAKIKEFESRNREGYSIKQHTPNDTVMITSRILTLAEALKVRNRYEKLEILTDQVLDLEFENPPLIIDRTTQYKTRDGITRIGRKMGFITVDRKEFQLPFINDTTTELLFRLNKGETHFRISREGSGYDSRYIILNNK